MPRPRSAKRSCGVKAGLPEICAYRHALLAFLSTIGFQYPFHCLPRKTFQFYTSVLPLASSLSILVLLRSLLVVLLVAKGM